MCSLSTALELPTFHWPSLAPCHTHIVAQLGMVGLELSGCFSKADDNCIHSTCNHAHHDRGEKESDQETQSEIRDASVNRG